MEKTLKIFFLFSLYISLSIVYAQDLGFSRILKNNPNTLSPFAVANIDSNKKILDSLKISIKYKNDKWLYFNALPSSLESLVQNRGFIDLYFEYNPPAPMNDSARAKHFVDSVHVGGGGLDRPYTGKGVILGIVDSGIEVNHPDFKDSMGRTKILRYWDHTIPSGSYSPEPYGYGYVWDSTEINNGLCTSTDATTHGSTVAGIAAGSGMANGFNYGMSPEADLIIVETNWGFSNWSLSIADACDFIFKVADSLGKPAVVNLSLGSYYGSHDGNDPAAEYIETLLDEKGGRIVVAAAGNSGNQSPYHVHNDITADTSFTWLINNPSNNSVFFDLYADTTADDWDYFIAVDRPLPNLSEAGRSLIRNAQDNVGTIIIQDITNDNGDMLCSMAVLTEIIYGVYHMQIALNNCDSVSPPDYRYRFATTGSGSYDLWSGSFNGFNDFYDDPISPSLYPNIINYRPADSLQSIVSSWNCSEKVVSVANMKNRSTFVDYNLNNYTSGPEVPGDLSASSSKGPNRHNLIKPDVTAAGEISLSATTLSFLANPANYYKIDSGGWHSLNGGTSMAAPVVAGIAGLYLERCPLSTYQDFINDLQSSSYTDQYTGSVPNYAFGYGKVHALDLILGMDLGPIPLITVTGSMQISSSDAMSYQWYLNGVPMQNENSQDLIVYETTGTYQVEITNYKGCTLTSDPVVITLELNEFDLTNKVFPNPTIDEIEIESSNTTINVSITDIFGKEVDIVPLGDNKFSLSHLPAGNYFILISANGKVSRSKLIKL